jgi:outer membrane protein assembly complex protein YaeT
MTRSLRAAIVLLALGAVACQDAGTVSVRRIQFEGVSSLDEASLRGALATRQSSSLPWGRKYAFVQARLEADLKRIEAFYADRGFPDARVTDFEVQFNEARTEVDIRVTVAEGQPVIVSELLFAGFDAIPAEDFRGLREGIPLSVGDPRDRQLVAAAHEMALTLLRDNGYPYARVTTTEDAGADARHVVVTFAAEPGTRAVFGPVEISGNSSVDPRVIERQLTYRPGDLYRRRIMQESQRRLYGMELFQFVNVEALGLEERAEAVRTRVTVTEGDHQRVNFGVGYGTEEKARVDGEYRHVNFLGGARSAGVNARWSSLDRGIRADLTQPYLFHPRLSLGLDGQQWYTFTPAYRSIITGGRGTITRRASSRTSWSVSVLSEYSSSAISNEALTDLTLRDELIALGLDPTTGRQEGRLSAVAFDYQHSTADNLLNARRGYQVAFHVEDAGALLPGDFGYQAATIDLRHYLPMGPQVVVANRLQVATIDEADGDPAKVPFSKKYFLGGATSVRGWGRYEVSPLSGSGFPIGGNSLFAFSSELRAMVRGNLGGVVFLDAGNVWEDGWTFDVGDLRYAVGTGIRYQTPVGPVRLDVGYQLNPIPDLLVEGEPQRRRWRIHFSIGQAF